MLPQHLVEEFWQNVESAMRKEHRMEPDSAKKWMEEFREVAAARIGDMIYRNNPQEVAEMVSGFAKQGRLPEPASMN